MAQYRIKRKNGKYYPEKKSFLFWYNVKVSELQVIENNYTFFDDANDFIHKKMNEDLTKIHYVNF